MTGAASPLRRETFLTPRHGLLNVLEILACHAGLVLWFAWAWPRLPLSLAVVLSVAVCLVHQRAMSEWLHEGAHHNLVPDRVWNERLTDWLVGAVFLTRTADYRAAHLAHHTRGTFFVPDDPDTAFFTTPTRRAFWLGLLKDLCGLNAVAQYRRMSASRDVGSAGAHLAALAGLHVAVMGALFAAGRVEAYLVYYVTLATVYAVLNRLRIYGQHLHVGRGTTPFAASPVSRSIDAGWLDRLFVTSGMMQFHYEHHQFPSLPYRALKAMCTRTADPKRYSTSRFAILRAGYQALPKATHD